MKKRIKKVLCFVMVLSILSTMSYAAAVPENDMVAPCLNYIAHITMGLDIDMYGKAYMHTGVTLYEMTHSCRLEMVLQRNDGSGWEDVKTWTASDGQNLDIEKYWYVLSGYEYRTENTIRAYNASGRLIETYTTYSDVRDY